MVNLSSIFLKKILPLVNYLCLCLDFLGNLGYYFAMGKKQFDLNDLLDFDGNAEMFARLAQGTLTDDEKAKLREMIWTIATKQVVQSLLADLPMQQKELAKKLNVTPAMITAYKQGTKLPSMPTFFMMCQELNPEMAEQFTSGTINQVNEMLKFFNFQL